MGGYRISELVERSGVPATTLRYYDTAGLLPAERSPAGYRLYGEPALERLDFIGRAKHLGLPLAEIAELLHVWESGTCREVKADLRPRLLARLADAERHSTDLARLMAVLRGAVTHLDALADRDGPCGPECDFLDLTGGTGDGDDRRWREAPVACSLTGDGQDDRARRWRQVLDGARRTRMPDGLELTVPSDRAAAVAELAVAEQACCPFFDFRIHLDGPELRLRVRAPAAGREMLAELFDLPREHGG